MKVALWRLKRGHGKFCSQSCAISYNHKGLPKPKSRINVAKATNALRGKPAWNRLPQILIICKQCGKTFYVQNCFGKTTKFCSRKCHYLFNKTIRGDKHFLFNQVPKICEWCGREYWVTQSRKETAHFCSCQCHGAYSVRKANKISKPEIIVNDALTNLGLLFESQYRIGKYSCDFALPQYNLVIEVDGDYWHSLSASIKRDKRKDIYLSSKGWIVLRFKEKDIYRNLTKCLIKINKYIPLFY